MYKLYNQNMYKIGKSINDVNRISNYSMYYIDDIEVIYTSEYNNYNNIAENILPLINT